MNRNDKWQNNKDYGRASDVQLNEAQRSAIGDLAIAHLASGNSDMFKLAISSLAKIDVQNEINAKFDAIFDRLAELK
mgnify:CR=1 FL=1|tara:strand:+ start:362 stop:592 length:231 start_codon:yes stop_codon:yes gene_type:complete